MKMTQRNEHNKVKNSQNKQTEQGANSSIESETKQEENEMNCQINRHISYTLYIPLNY